MALNVFLILVAYVLGSIPSAVWIGKRFYGIDVREHGSRNAGATNTLRVLGARAALPVFAIDILKGFAAVMLAHLSGYEAGFPRRQGSRHAGRSRAGRIPGCRSALSGRFRPCFRIDALRVARLDERRGSVSDIHPDSEAAASGLARGVRLRDRPAAAVYASQEYTSFIDPQRVEDLPVQA